MRCLTDSTGILQHARFALPHTPEGYCTDDNARALDLTVTIESMRLSPIQPRVSDLITTYAAFVNAAFVSDTALFRNFMGYDRRWLDDRGTDDCQGRALSALATCIAKSRDENLRRWAAGMFLKALPTILDARSPRAWAHAMIGIGEYSQSLPGATGARHIGDTLRERLLTCFAAAKSESWPWFEASLAYDNAILSHALIVRGRNDPESLEVGLRSLEWLMQLQTAPEGHFRPIGCNGFYSRNGERARFDQQPIEAAGMVSACLAAFRVTGNSAWVECARVAFAWFHGGNDLGIPVVDRLTGGCRDGLCVDRLNMNQGAESTLAYLSARVQMEGHLGAGERIDRQAGNSVSPNGIGGPAEDNPVAAVTVAVTRRHTANASRALAL